MMAVYCANFTTFSCKYLRGIGRCALFSIEFYFLAANAILLHGGCYISVMLIISL